jgi:predicted negative regulator of RcsB-dependent stress response
MKRTQKGFAHLALLLLVVAAIVAYAGYKVVKNHQQTATVNQAGTAMTKTVSDTIKTSADLDKAAATLNSQNIDNDLNPSSLDNDVSGLQ